MQNGKIWRKRGRSPRTLTSSGQRLAKNRKTKFARPPGEPVPRIQLCIPGEMVCKWERAAQNA